MRLSLYAGTPEHLRNAATPPPPDQRRAVRERYRRPSQGRATGSAAADQELECREAGRERLPGREGLSGPAEVRRGLGWVLSLQYSIHGLDPLLYSRGRQAFDR